MALNEVRTITLDVNRDSIRDILLELCGSINEFLPRPLPKNPAITDFYDRFPEGNWGLEHTSYFFRQTRLQYKNQMRGRLGLSYSSDNSSGKLSVQIIDNGERIPEDLFNDVSSAIKKYASSHHLTIVDEKSRSE